MQSLLHGFEYPAKMFWPEGSESFLLICERKLKINNEVHWAGNSNWTSSNSILLLLGWQVFIFFFFCVFSLLFGRVLVACPKTGAPRPDYTTLITDHFSNNNHTDLILPYLEITSESFWGYSLFYRQDSGSKNGPISSEHCCVKSRNLAELYDLYSCSFLTFMCRTSTEHFKKISQLNKN